MVQTAFRPRRAAPLTRAMAALVLAGAGALLAAHPAHAFTGVFDDKAKQALSGVAGALTTGASAPPAAAAAAKPAAAAPARSPGRYAPSAAVNQQVRQEVVQALVDNGKRRGTLDAAKEKALRESLGKTDVAKTVGDLLAAKGYAANSLATAMAYWVMVNYDIVRGAQATDAQNAAVLRQLEQRVDSSPDIARMSDADKQRAAEGMLWFATLQLHAWQEAGRGAPGYDARAIQADSREALTSLGVDASTVQLGAAGLAPR